MAFLPHFLTSNKLSVQFFFFARLESKIKSYICVQKTSRRTNRVVGNSIAVAWDRKNCQKKKNAGSYAVVDLSVISKYLVMLLLEHKQPFILKCSRICFFFDIDMIFRSLLHRLSIFCVNEWAENQVEAMSLGRVNLPSLIRNLNKREEGNEQGISIWP